MPCLQITATLVCSPKLLLTLQSNKQLIFVADFECDNQFLSTVVFVCKSSILY